MDKGRFWDSRWNMFWLGVAVATFLDLVITAIKDVMNG